MDLIGKNCEPDTHPAQCAQGFLYAFVRICIVHIMLGIGGPERLAYIREYILSVKILRQQLAQRLLKAAADSVAKRFDAARRVTVLFNSAVHCVHQVGLRVECGAIEIKNT